MPTCNGITNSGSSCRRTIKVGARFCHDHRNTTVSLPSRKPAVEESSSSLSIDDSVISECVLKYTGHRKQAQLGKGEKGAVFAIDQDKVVKVSTFHNIEDETAWCNEARIGTYLGELGVSPVIHSSFICARRGFIIMDRITTMSSKTIPHETATFSQIDMRSSRVVRYRIVDERQDVIRYFDNIPLINHEQQVGFIRVLETMIDRGYIHMDNHVDNLGFVRGMPIVFDFGFTQERPHINRRWALCFSLFQILEHCPPQLLEECVFYKVATACMNNTYQWREIDSGQSIPLSELRGVAMLDQNGILHRNLYSLVHSIFTPDQLDTDLELGSKAYAILMERSYRYGGILNFIYMIRNPDHTDGVDPRIVDIMTAGQQ